MGRRRTFTAEEDELIAEIEEENMRKKLLVDGAGERKSQPWRTDSDRNWGQETGRKILDWELCETMEAINIELLVARVKEKYPEAHARIIHDNGKQFISKDFKDLISVMELYETSARVCHPQSNGKLERFHSTIKNWTCP